MCTPNPILQEPSEENQEKRFFYCEQVCISPTHFSSSIAGRLRLDSIGLRAKLTLDNGEKSANKKLYRSHLTFALLPQKNVYKLAGWKMRLDAFLMLAKPYKESVLTSM